MFKKISVFLVLVLVITTLSACAGSEGSNAELTKEKKKEIARAWLVYKKEIWDWDLYSEYRYYGNYNGYDMFLYQSTTIVSLRSYEKYEIGGQKFIVPVSFNMYAYRNGKFYDLNEIKILHLIGIISRKSLAAMAETNKTWFSRFYNEAA